MATCRGVDVSSIQATSAWTKYTDLSFVIAKASEGQSSRDSAFAGHIAAARKLGLTVGGYHFGWPVQDVSKEAANYIAAVKSVAAAGAFTHWLDLEAYSDGRNTKGMSAAQIKAWAASWIAKVKAAYPGQRVGVYASASTFTAGWVPTNADAYWVAAYPVAGLSWANAEARTPPALPAAYAAPLIWQFGSTSPALDRDLAYLSSSNLAVWAAGEEDDVALTDADKTWLTNAIKANSFTGAWTTDKIAAPADDPNVKTNPTWQPQSYLKDTNARVRALQTAEAAQTAAITALAKLVGSNVDTATVVAAVQKAVADAVIKVDVNVTGPASS